MGVTIKRNKPIPLGKIQAFKKTVNKSNELKKLRVTESADFPVRNLIEVGRVAAAIQYVQSLGRKRFTYRTLKVKNKVVTRVWRVT